MSLTRSAVWCGTRIEACWTPATPRSGWVDAPVRLTTLQGTAEPSRHRLAITPLPARPHSNLKRDQTGAVKRFQPRIELSRPTPNFLEHSLEQARYPVSTKHELAIKQQVS